MNRHSGNIDFPIWLIGDSSPPSWADDLVDPLDAKHPARHNIWTPILDGIQSRLYASAGMRLRTDDLYVRNAVHLASDRPRDGQSEWPSLKGEIRELSRLFDRHAPKLVFSFGAFAFEFARRARHESPHHAFRHWSAELLGKQFRARIGAFSPHLVNLVPLLHVSIARRHFLANHRYFTQLADGNYFDHVAEHIAGCLISNQLEFPVR